MLIEILLSDKLDLKLQICLDLSRYDINIMFEILNDVWRMILVSIHKIHKLNLDF